MTILGWCVKEYPSHNLCNSWMIMENNGAPVEACKCLCHQSERKLKSFYPPGQFGKGRKEV